MKLEYDIPTDEWELIEDYLRNELTPEQSVIFQEKKRRDIHWPNKINEVKLLQAGISELILSKQLDSFHDGVKETQEKNKPVIKMITRWAVAASVLIIVSVSLWLLNNSQTGSARLYANFYQPDPGLMTAMGSSEDYAFEQGMVNYKNEEYKKAISSWDTLLAKTPSNDTLHYFLGAAHQALGNDEKAKKHLMIIVSEKGNAFYKDACWYLGLLLLKEKQTKDAIIYIQQSQHSEAQALLNAINQNK